MMGSLGRRSEKLVSDSFRSYLPCNKRFSPFEHSLVPAWDRAKGISPHSLVSQSLGLGGGANRNLLKPFLNEARRFYCVNRHYTMWKHWKSQGLRWRLRVGVLMVICCSVVTVKAYYDHLEMVPYHDRTRFILYSEPELRSSSERTFKRRKESFKGRILSDTHPESIRVRRIAQDIFDAYKVEIQQEGSQLSTTSHLDGLDWEILPVRGFGHAISLQCGKIIFYDWMFEHITSDAEIAFLVAREVGYIVARHFAEGLTIATFLRILIPILKVLKPILVQIDLWEAVMDKCVIPSLRVLNQQKVEADYIGMHLSALAGYDPRVAPKLLEKMDKHFALLEKMDKYWIHNSYPSTKGRAEFLSRPEVMEKPVSIYLRGPTYEDV